MIPKSVIARGTYGVLNTTHYVPSPILGTLHLQQNSKRCYLSFTDKETETWKFLKKNLCLVHGQVVFQHQVSLDCNPML